MFHTCKITVIERKLDRKLIDAHLAHPERMSICDKMVDGQEFIVENPYEIPEGICASAWADMRTYIIAIASGGSFEFMREKDSILASCTDLFRPVIFRIERV
jgi:uncharacterized repeat protein (TIGR04076 family)